jgi:alkaline phosphatase D
MSLNRRSVLGLALTQAACTAAPPLLGGLGLPDRERFALGIASGQPRADGMVLWTAVTGPALPPQVAVQWEVAEDEAFRRIVARGSEMAVAEDAHTVHAEPTGLASDRWYWYRFGALGGQSEVGRTRTAPAAGAAVARLDFAIASCQRWDTGHYAAWRHAVAENLDLVLFLGDYIYEYASTEKSLRATDDAQPVRTLEAFRRRYRLHKSDAALRAAHAAAPWLLVWDDHEVENDYAGLQGNRLQPDFAAQRAAAYRAYWEFMPLPKASRPVDGSLRMYGSLDWGSLARVHLLDDRQYRDPQACQRPGRGGSGNVVERECAALTDPARTLLGAAQERWLADSWSLQQPWNLLAQQTLMARFGTTAPADGGGTYWTDGWDGYPAARRRLLSAVAERRVPGVVVLGGDVHANYVADLHLDFDRPGAQPLATEFCGTSISSLGLAQSWVENARRFAPHMRYGRSDQRGYVRFTLQPRELRAELRVLDDGLRADSGISTGARFVVDAARPGAQPA